MKQRCHNPSSKDFARYGARGITVSEKWFDFTGFMDDMRESYEKHVKEYGERNTQIDRVDNNDGYNKYNCRWVTMRENLNNRRNYTAVGLNGRKTNWGKNV